MLRNTGSYDGQLQVIASELQLDLPQAAHHSQARSAPLGVYVEH